MIKHASTAQQGGGLIEVLIGAAILIIVVVGITGLYGVMVRSAREVVHGTQAQLLAEEGIEAVRVIRDTAWSGVASTTPATSYALVWQSNTWGLVASTTPALIDDTFSRSIVFSRVYRDASDDIAASGTLDAGTYRVDVTVTWGTQTGTSTRIVSSYITNLFE